MGYLGEGDGDPGTPMLFVTPLELRWCKSQVHGYSGKRMPYCRSVSIVMVCARSSLSVLAFQPVRWNDICFCFLSVRGLASLLDTGSKRTGAHAVDSAVFACFVLIIYLRRL